MSTSRANPAVNNNTVPALPPHNNLTPAEQQVADRLVNLADAARTTAPDALGARRSANSSEPVPAPRGTAAAEQRASPASQAFRSPATGEAGKTTGTRHEKNLKTPLVAAAQANFVSTGCSITTNRSLELQRGITHMHQLHKSLIELEDKAIIAEAARAEAHRHADTEAERAIAALDRADKEAKRADKEVARANKEAERADKEVARADKEAERANKEAARADKEALKCAQLLGEPNASYNQCNLDELRALEEQTERAVVRIRKAREVKELAAAVQRAHESAAECVVCKDRSKDTLLKCGHLLCRTCAETMKQCPLCRKPIMVQNSGKRPFRAVYDS